MISITKINLKKSDKVQKKFINNIKLVLQKIGSNHKTKVLHNLADKELLYIGHGTVDISKKRSVEYGVNYLSSGKLSGLCADISAIVDKADLPDVASKIKETYEAYQEVTRVKTTITDTSTMQINKLEKQIEKNFDELLDSIDYFSLVDVYYYLYINALTITGLKGKGKNKIFETTYSVFKEIVNKLLRNAHADISYENNRKKDIICDYIFARKFTDQSAQTTLAKLVRMYGEPALEFMVDIKPQQYEEFSNIATLLTKAGIVNITESAFNTNFRTIMGTGADAAMDGAFDELVAYIVSIKYKSSVFNAQIVAKDEQERLEELILNFKRDITLGK